MNTEPGVESRYWVHVTDHDGQEKISSRKVNSLCISVVLDFEARYEFSAIRLLILSKRSKDFDSINIVNCNEPNQCVSVVRETAYRDCYRRRLVKTQSKKRDQVQLPVSRICTVVFEIVYDLPGVRIVQTSAQQSDLDTAGIPFRRIVYEHTQPINAADSTLLVLLSANTLLLQPFVRPFSNEIAFLIPMHSVRIVPLPSERRGSITLPSDIIHRITQFSVGYKYYGWRTCLLNYSLVSKAWKDVLAIFFELLDGDWRYQVDARHVLRTLRWRPCYGASIRVHDYKNYISNDDSWVAFMEILGYATHAKYLHLPIIPPYAVPFVIDTLQKLPDARKFVVKQCSSMNVADFQKAIANWKHLKELRLTGSGAPQDRDPTFVSSSRLQCSIEDLTLLECALSTPGQLLCFVGPTNCQLTHIAFGSITGPSNDEFREFLFIAAPTLTTIDLFLCHFPCAPGDEFALDAVMPEMKKLERLLVNKSDISALSIIRRPPPPGRASYDKIEICSARPGITVQDVERAMHVTEWGLVTVRWMDLPVWDPATVARAEGVARDRGKILILSR